MKSTAISRGSTSAWAWGEFWSSAPNIQRRSNEMGFKWDLVGDSIFFMGVHGDLAINNRHLIGSNGNLMGVWWGFNAMGMLRCQSNLAISPIKMHAFGTTSKQMQTCCQKLWEFKACTGNSKDKPNDCWTSIIYKPIDSIYLQYIPIKCPLYIPISCHKKKCRMFPNAGMQVACTFKNMRSSHHTFVHCRQPGVPWSS